MSKTCIATIVFLFVSAGLTSHSQAQTLSAENIMAFFGAKGETAFTAQRIANFSDHFARLDGNGDGSLTSEETVQNSSHFRGNPRGAHAFMRVSDRDQDGFVSLSEYVTNRIITDEAREIFLAIDPAVDRQGTPGFRWEMTKAAFVGSARFRDRDLAAQIFTQMDLNQDGKIRLPEYLRAYGGWARAGLPPHLLDGKLE